MKIFLSLVLPFVILLIPIGLLIFISKKWAMEKLTFALIASGCFALGLIVPFISTFVSASGLAYGYKGEHPLCVTGAASFFMLGYMINLIGVPITAVILFPWKTIIRKI